MGSVTVDMQEMDEITAVEKGQDVSYDRHQFRRNEQGMAPLDTAAVTAATSNEGLERFRDMFNQAMKIEKEKNGSEAAKKWEEATAGLEAADHEVELEKIQELSSVQ